LQVIEDLLRKYRRFRKVRGVFETLVLEPKDVEVCLVALDQLVVVILSPATVRRRLRPARLA